MSFKYWNYCRQLFCIESDFCRARARLLARAHSVINLAFDLCVSCTEMLICFIFENLEHRMLSFHKKVYFISLIPTDSCWMNLHKKPFFTSVLLIQSIIVIATTNKICTFGRSMYPRGKNTFAPFQNITLQMKSTIAHLISLPSLIC